MEIIFSDFRARGARPTKALDAAILGSTGIRVEVPDGAGGWRLMTHYYPRRYRDELALDSLGSGPCRLIFVGRHRLHFIGRIVPAATAATPQGLPLATARHSRLGDQRGAVSQAGGLTTALVAGDTLTLEFSADPVPEGQVRDYFLLATGVYAAAAAPLTQQQPPPEVALPAAFALRQNQPNPFDRTTTIRFELPVASPVRLEVFDLQGRRVAVLAEGERPAGFHAIAWDPRDGRGTTVPPGIYLYRLIAGAFRDQKKMMLFE
ncbi:MAG: FlgD immunoglobulin-like domain containing protein [Candidatus Eiseniibacteriota bacterium]